jgi:hypothetical protein
VTVDELADALDSQRPVLVTDKVKHADIFTLVLPTVDRLAGSVGLWTSQNPRSYLFRIVRCTYVDPDLVLGLDNVVDGDLRKMSDHKV